MALSRSRVHARVGKCISNRVPELGVSPGLAHFSSLSFLSYVSDGTTAMFIGCLFFVIPRELPRFTLCFPSRGKRSLGSATLSVHYSMYDPILAPQMSTTWRPLLTWDLMQKKFSWSIVLLLGGAYAMADGVESSGLDDWISSGLVSLQSIPTAVFVGVSVVLVTFLTEFSSNVAVASIFIPIGASMVSGYDLHCVSDRVLT